MSSELAAWRFLAAHRVGSLTVTHVTFVDGDDGAHLNTPSRGPNYEGATAPTFGEAAIELARKLGMDVRWATECDEAPLDCAAGKSSARTARRGASSRNSPATASASAASTTGATGADRGTGASAEKPSLSADKLELLCWECGAQATDATRAGHHDDAEEWKAIRATLEGMK